MVKKDQLVWKSIYPSKDKVHLPHLASAGSAHTEIQNTLHWALLQAVAASVENLLGWD